MGQNENLKRVKPFDESFFSKNILFFVDIERVIVNSFFKIL